MDKQTAFAFGMIAFAILGATLAITNPFDIPIVFAHDELDGKTTVGKDYTLTYNDDHTAQSIIGGTPKVQDNQGGWLDHIYNEDANTIQIETGHGSVSLNKSACGFSYFNSGRINEDSTPLFTDSIIARMATVDTDDWTHIAVLNNADCQASWNGSELTASKLKSGVGLLEYKYINDNGKWKTQLEATNLSSLTDKKFGLTQTIDLNRDTIHFGGSQKNLDDFDGTTFDRAWLENNDGKVIDLMNGAYYDFDLAFDNLWAVTVTDTGIDSSKLSFDFAFNSQVLLPNETLILDPVFAEVQEYNLKFRSPASQTSSCGDWSQATSTSSAYLFSNPRANLNAGCLATAHGFSTASIPTGSTVTDVDIVYDIDLFNNAGGAVDCDWSLITNDPLTDSAGTIGLDITDDTTYGASDANCNTTGNGKTLDLGATGDSEVQTQLDAGDPFWLGISHHLDPNRHATSKSDLTQYSDFYLVVTFTLPPVSNNPTSMTVNQINGTALNATWVEPVDPTFQGVTLTRNSTALLTDLSAITISHWAFEGDLTDDGLEGNTWGLLAGNEYYTNGYKGVAFYDGTTSQILESPIGQENDYDICALGDDCGFAMWVNVYDGIDSGSNILGKCDAGTSSACWGISIDTDEEIRLLLQDASVENILCEGAGTPLTLNEWNFVQINFDGTGSDCTGVSIKINDVSASLTDTSTLTYSTASNVESLRLHNAYIWGYPHQFAIDEIMIFSRDLTDAESTNLYQHGLITDSFFVDTGLSPLTWYEYEACSWGVGGYNSTSCPSDIENTLSAPDAPSIVATAVSGTAVDVVRTAGASDGGSSVTDYRLRYELNETGGWVNLVTNSPIVNFYNHTSIPVTSDLVYQWADTNLVGWSDWSANATASNYAFTNATITQASAEVVGNVVLLKPTVSIIDGLPAPEVQSLIVLFNGSSQGSISTSQTINPSDNYLFDNLLYFEIDVGTPINATIQAIISNTTGTVTIESAGEIIQREYAPIDDLAETSSLGHYNYTIDSTDPNNRVLKVNRPFDNATSSWDIGCKSVTGFQDAGLTWYNGSDVGFFKDTLSASGGQNVYLTCYNPPAILFSTVSYGNLTGVLAGFSGFDDQLGSWFGLPMIFMFVFFIAGLFGGRQSGTSIVITLAVIAILGGIGLLAIDEAIWGIMLVLGALGLFASRVRF